MLVRAYLTLYNVLSAAGWGYVLYLALENLKSGGTPAEAWANLGLPLTVVQSTMALEIFHALLGLVRSPVFVTFMQVTSRLVVVWGATYWLPACQEHWSLYLIVVSWAIVEIVRYSFYASNLVTGTTPFPLFWLRYSLFMVLYPTGITGEVVQLLVSMPYWQVSAPVWYRSLILILAVYVPGSPFMINNMWRNRKSALKKRKAAAAGASSPRPLEGLVWPVTNPKTQERSTSRTNKTIWVQSVEGVDAAAATAAKKEKNWRYGYVAHVETHVRLSLADTTNALAIAEAGLGAAHEAFEFKRGSDTFSLRQAMEEISGSFGTHKITGTAQRDPKASLAIPYGGRRGRPYYEGLEQRNDLIEGKALLAQINVWVEDGVIEPDCGEALRLCATKKAWLDLSEHYFILLGATSAMGPIKFLLSLGANVIAIDLDRPQIWKKLFQMARESCGTLIFPVREGTRVEGLSEDDLAAVSGANLLQHTPEIANWLCQVCPEKKITVGNYTYLDGALHVQLSLACDAIIAKLAAVRSELAIAFLCTPTDCHPIPKAAHDAARAKRAAAPFWQKLSPLLVGNDIAPVTEKSSGDQIYLVDGVVAAQGPNYILAKRIQHWRAIIERSRGHVISSNIAPSTATASVVHNPQFAAAYGGMHLFQPLEVMFQETSNAIMGALLLHDVQNERAAGNPKVPLSNPLRMFEYGSFHGGVWRCGFKMGTIGEMSALAYYLKFYWFAMGAGSAAVAAVAVWVATGELGPIPLPTSL